MNRSCHQSGPSKTWKPRTTNRMGRRLNTLSLVARCGRFRRAGLCLPPIAIADAALTLLRFFTAQAVTVLHELCNRRLLDKAVRSTRCTRCVLSTLIGCMRHQCRKQINVGILAGILVFAWIAGRRLRVRSKHRLLGNCLVNMRFTGLCRRLMEQLLLHRFCHSRRDGGRQYARHHRRCRRVRHACCRRRWLHGR